jgi:hypothetical protein
VSKFLISLDFELFWGVVDSQTMASYGRNVESEWTVVPQLLSLFQRYGVRATWATVGMAMCRDYSEWQQLRPAVFPGYSGTRHCTYSVDRLVREYPKLFFARPLVEQIMSFPGQEIATHTYSHFFCGDSRATPEQLAADLACAKTIASDMHLIYRSMVFPRNQVVESFLPVLVDAGIKVYRGNANHWLYRNGNFVAGGKAGRAVRLADAWLPLTGARTTKPMTVDGLVNVPASFFLYPCTRQLEMLEPIRLLRLKQCMTAAARSDGIFHLWWHPHNFGANHDRNLAFLGALLEHYARLHDQYGMTSVCMEDFAPMVKTPSWEWPEKSPRTSAAG